MPGRGPLPNPEHRHRNKPTIPTTHLPVCGRQAPAPPVPSWVKLGKAARAWWRWAWVQPQACGWSEGDAPAIARRAVLEDIVAALEEVNGLDLIECLDTSEEGKLVKVVIKQLAAAVGGRISLYREMRELDDRLGLTPKGLAQLRWKIVEGEVDIERTAPEQIVASLDDRRRRLTGA